MAVQASGRLIAHDPPDAVTVPALFVALLTVPAIRIVSVNGLTVLPNTSCLASVHRHRHRAAPPTAALRRPTPMDMPIALMTRLWGPSPTRDV